MAQVALGDAPTTATRPSATRMTELLAMDEPRRRIAGMISGLDVRYDLGEGHPLLGRRMPDLDLAPPTARPGCPPCCTTPGRCCSTSASPAASTSPVGGPRPAGRGRARRARGSSPSLGEVAAPAAVLIRPDGHVAWAGDPADPELPRALTTWCGPADPAR